MINCALYKTPRAKLQEKLNLFSSIKLRDRWSFEYILETFANDWESSTAICEFINKCFEIRDAASYITPPIEWASNSFMLFYHPYSYIYNYNNTGATETI